MTKEPRIFGTSSCTWPITAWIRRVETMSGTGCAWARSQGSRSPRQTLEKCKVNLLHWRKTLRSYPCNLELLESFHVVLRLTCYSFSIACPPTMSPFSTKICLPSQVLSASLSSSLTWLRGRNFIGIWNFFKVKKLGHFSTWQNVSKASKMLVPFDPVILFLGA